MPRSPPQRRWIRRVKAVSTFPPEGLLTKDAETIARVMATRRVSPRASGRASRWFYTSCVVFDPAVPSGFAGIANARKTTVVPP